MKRIWTPLLVATLLCWSTVAAAQTLAGLQTEVGKGVDANVRSEITSSIGETASSVDSWTWVETSRARAAMNPVVRDCFTADCLRQAGTAVGAEAGLRVQFSGESQIYDWTINIFDLRSGQELNSARGACELCGRAEVVREFKASLKGAIAATKVPRAAAKRQDTKPDMQPDGISERRPEQTTEPSKPTDVEPTDPQDSQIGDLVMVEVTAQPDDTIIMVDGEEAGLGSATVSLKPGTHELIFAREGYRGLKETFVVGPQTSPRTFMRVHLSKTDPDAVMVEPAIGPIDRLGNQRITYGVASLATGGALLALGMWLNYLDGRITCETGAFRDCPDVYETTTGAFITTFAGATLITGGAILLAWEYLAGEQEEETARIAPALVGDGLGLSLGGRF